MNLSITDGFKFGCGLILAVGSAVALLLVVFTLVTFVFTLIGVRLPFP